jgi:LmbE family N-acetylglucosaminyl deacetylase
VAAHPHDLDSGAAGTIATWTAAGIAVTYSVRTSGDRFSRPPRVRRGRVRRGVPGLAQPARPPVAGFGAIARAAGLGEGRIAEIFQLVDTR